MARWGQLKYVLFSPLFGEDSNLTNIFADGLKPPTKWLITCDKLLLMVVKNSAPNKLQMTSRYLFISFCFTVCFIYWFRFSDNISIFTQCFVGQDVGDVSTVAGYIPDIDYER